MSVAARRRGAYSGAMLENVRVRAACAADREPVCDLVRAVLEEYSLTFKPDGIDADLLAIPDNYLAAGGAFDVVVDAADRVQGTVGLWPLSATAIELRKMYFAPSLRGFGVGKAILDRALLMARAQGFVHVELETARVLTEAIGLYRSFGFDMTSEPATASRCDYRMVRRLSDYRSPPDLLTIKEVKRE